MRPLTFLYLSGNLALVRLKFDLNNIESLAHPRKKNCGESHEALFVTVDKPSSRAGPFISSLLQVLFDDIAQSMIRLSSQDLQFQLVAAFLQFLGVPSGLSPPASCLYLAMDENSIFDDGLHDEMPLTFLNLSFSGVSCVGCSDPLGRRRWTRGHNREGEEFIRNIFHLVMPLFSGRERSQLCFSWLRYEIEKVTLASSTPRGGFVHDHGALGVPRSTGPHHLLVQGPQRPLVCGCPC